MLLRNDDIIAPQLAKSDIIWGEFILYNGLKRNCFNVLDKYSNLTFAIYTQTSL